MAADADLVLMLSLERVNRLEGALWRSIAGAYVDVLRSQRLLETARSLVTSRAYRRREIDSGA